VLRGWQGNGEDRYRRRVRLGKKGVI
jgi:hypothetical protein